MSDKTPRFGFSFFGGSVAGALTDDGSAFTMRDRLALDHILEALEGHQHSNPAGGQRVPDPTGIPAATLLTGGTLEAGQTLYYVVTFVDRHGLETASSDEIAIETATIVATPASPDAVTATGGTLTPGLYYYAVTALVGADETTLSAPELATVLEGEGTVVLTLPDLPAGADSLRVWRQGPGEGTFSRLDIATDITFTDDGSIPPDPCPWDPSHQPPTSNTTSSDGAVQIDLAPEDAAVLNDPAREIQSWRLYRTSVSGVYGAQSLVSEVSTRTVELDPASPLVTSYIDDGATLLAGSPPQSSQTLAEPLPYVLPSATALPADAVGYPEMYPLMVDGVLYVAQAGAWVPVTSAGGGASQTQAPTADPIFTGTDGRRWMETVDGTGAKVLAETQLPGAPTPPTSVAVAGTNVTWAAPAYDGGLAVTGYVVCELDSTGARTETPVGPTVTSSPLTITNGFAWVLAVNAMGRSQASVVQVVAPGGAQPYWATDTAPHPDVTFAPGTPFAWSTVGAPVATTAPFDASGGGMTHPTTGLRYALFRIGFPVDQVAVNISVTLDAPPSAEWYIDVLSRDLGGNDGAGLPTDFSMGLAYGYGPSLYDDNGALASSASGSVTLSLGVDYYIAIASTAELSGTITVDPYVEPAAVTSAPVTVRNEVLAWAGPNFGSHSAATLLLSQQVWNDGSYDIHVGVDGATAVTGTVYQYTGATDPATTADLTLVGPLNALAQGANVTTMTLTAGRYWVALDLADDAETGTFEIVATP